MLSLGGNKNAHFGGKMKSVQEIEQKMLLPILMITRSNRL